MNWLRAVATTLRMAVVTDDEIPDEGIDAFVGPKHVSVPNYRINVQLKAGGERLRRADGSVAYDIGNNDRYQALVRDADGNSGLLLVVETPDHPFSWLTDNHIGGLSFPVRSWWVDVGTVPGNVGAGLHQHKPPGKIVLPAGNVFSPHVLLRKAYAVRHKLGPIS